MAVHVYLYRKSVRRWMLGAEDDVGTDDVGTGLDDDETVAARGEGEDSNVCEEEPIELEEDAFVGTPTSHGKSPASFLA